MTDENDTSIYLVLVFEIQLKKLYTDVSFKIITCMYYSVLIALIMKQSKKKA